MAQENVEVPKEIFDDLSRSGRALEIASSNIERLVRIVNSLFGKGATFTITLPKE